MDTSRLNKVMKQAATQLPVGGEPLYNMSNVVERVKSDRADERDERLKEVRQGEDISEKSDKTSQLKAIISQEISTAMGASTNDLAVERTKALQYYYGEKYGNETDSRSQIVTREVAETVEWIMPQLMEVFTSSNNIAYFQPLNEGDEAAAAQETDVINHVLNVQNNGFVILYTWFKDALIQKNGIVKYWWQENERTIEEEYEDLTEQQVHMLMADELYEVKGVTAEKEGNDSLGMPATLYDIVVNKKVNGGKVVVEAVPPNELLVHRDTKWNLQETLFCCHRTLVTRSDLVDYGYDKKVVDDLPSGDVKWDNLEELARRNLSDEWRQATIDSNGAGDKARDYITLYECYIRYDFDGDGIAELRRVVYAGYKILHNSEVDRIPFSYITPILLSHKFYGMSIADLVMQLQLIKSTLMRNLLDNIYLINNQRTAVVDGKVNLSDLRVNRPGGIVRMSAPNMIQEIATKPLGGYAFQMLEYLEGMKENLSGSTRYNQGLDSHSLNKTAHGIQQIMSASQQRIKLIARTFAEVGMKDLIVGIHGLLRKHQDIPMTMKLRHKWVDVRPQDWVERMDASVELGATEVDKGQKLQGLNNMLSIQLSMLKDGIPVVKPENIYTTLMKIAEAMGEKSPERFFTSPDVIDEEQKNNPPPPNPEIELKKQELQIKQQKVQGDLSIKVNKMQTDEAMRRGQLMLNADIQNRQTQVMESGHEHKAAMDIMGAQVDETNQHLQQAYDMSVAHAGMMRNGLE